LLYKEVTGIIFALETAA